MLRQLRIRHLILVENAEAAFHSGLNIISGETGAGKSAMMTALALVMGERADSSVLRRGEDSGYVEAIFECSEKDDVLKKLAEAGIAVEDGEIVVRREVHSKGKSRAYINDRTVQLAFLREVGQRLVKMVGQSASQVLRNVDNHRNLLDLFVGNGELVNKFKTSWEQEKTLVAEADKIRREEAQRLREIEMYRREIEEIDTAELKPGEEEEVFAEYTKLTHGEELRELTEQAIHHLEGEGGGALDRLRLVCRLIEEAMAVDTAFEEPFHSLQQALVEVEEAAYTLNRHHSALQVDPRHLSSLNDRLALINKIKKKYGSDVEQVLGYRDEIAEKLEGLEHADTRLEEIEEELVLVRQEVNALAAKLTQERTEGAVVMGRGIERHLHHLNMPKAECVIRVAPAERTSRGDDLVEFFLAPNVGEEAVSVRGCASGGEVSRLMLALQTLLAGKEEMPTLVFDEIDANIGGRTANHVGEKLQTIGKQHQVLCITHFPQVAKKGHHHLQIAKEEVDGRTLTLFKTLKGKALQNELSRMRGE